jgi:hypothetical protein
MAGGALASKLERSGLLLVTPPLGLTALGAFISLTLSRLLYILVIKIECITLTGEDCQSEASSGFILIRCRICSFVSGDRLSSLCCRGDSGTF